MFSDFPPEQVCGVCEACAAELLEEAGVGRPPVDAFRMARRLGFTVVHGAAPTPRAQLVAIGGGGGGRTIVLADEPRPERRHWAVAHELGEARAWRVFERLSVGPRVENGPVREWVANRLAGMLLVPGRWCREDGAACGWDLAVLKSIYHTASHELIAQRMLQLHESVVVTVFDRGRMTWRRGSGAIHPPRLLPEERTTWQRVHEGGGFAELPAERLPPSVSGVRCWPVHEPDWRREILATEISVWDQD